MKTTETTTTTATGSPVNTPAPWVGAHAENKQVPGTCVPGTMSEFSAAIAALNSVQSALPGARRALRATPEYQSVQALVSQRKDLKSFLGLA